VGHSERISERFVGIIKRRARRTIKGTTKGRASELSRDLSMKII